jgi:hypothetical protein
VPVPVSADRIRHTVDGALEALSAHLAGQGADAELLLQLDLDRFLVVAEEAGECRGEGFALLGAGGLAGGLLSFALDRGRGR